MNEGKVHPMILGSFLGLAPDKLYDQRLGRALRCTHIWVRSRLNW